MSFARCNAKLDALNYMCAAHSGLCVSVVSFGARGILRQDKVTVFIYEDS